MARLTYVHAESDLGGVKLVADLFNGTYYMLVDDDARPTEVPEILRVAEKLGLEAMDEDECPAERTQDGKTLVWLASFKDQQCL